VVTFRELVEGDVPPQDNPFYHHRLSGKASWWKTGNTVRLDEKWGSGDGQLELAVKAGFYVELEIRQDNWGHYAGSEDAIGWGESVGEVNYVKTFDQNWDSYLQFRCFGGSLVAVSSEKLVLSNTMKGLFTQTNRKYGTMLSLTPNPQTTWEVSQMEDGNAPRTRFIAYGDADRKCWITLTAWGRDTEFGVAVQEQTVSMESEGVTEEQIVAAEESGSSAVFSDWTYDRIYEKQTDPEGWEYDISIAWRSEAGPYRVITNGVTEEDYPSYGGAEEYANFLNEKYSTDGLPPMLRREVGEKEIEKKFELKMPEVDWWKVGGAGTILLGVVIGGLVIFFAVRAFGTTAGKKAAGGE
jgi:hypothetical protein